MYTVNDGEYTRTSASANIDLKWSYVTNRTPALTEFPITSAEQPEYNPVMRFSRMMLRMMVRDRLLSVKRLHLTAKLRPCLHELGWICHETVLWDSLSEYVRRTYMRYGACTVHIQPGHAMELETRVCDQQTESSTATWNIPLPRTHIRLVHLRICTYKIPFNKCRGNQQAEIQIRRANGAGCSSGRSSRWGIGVTHDSDQESESWVAGMDWIVLDSRQSMIGRNCNGTHSSFR